MVTIYHNLNSNLNSAAGRDERAPSPQELELAGVVSGTESLDEAFDRTIHRDGEHWTDDPTVRFFGDRRCRRSSHEGDVFVLGDGTAYLVLTHGFRLLPALRLPFLSR